MTTTNPTVKEKRKEEPVKLINKIFSNKPFNKLENINFKKVKEIKKKKFHI